MGPLQWRFWVSSPPTAATFILPSADGSTMPTLTGFRRMKDSSSSQEKATSSSASSAKTCWTCERRRVGRNAATLNGRSRSQSTKLPPEAP